MRSDLTDEQIEAYARFLVLDQAKDVETLTVYELTEEHFGKGFELTYEESERVHEKIRSAKVAVTFS